jgi:hypothetical protein
MSKSKSTQNHYIVVSPVRVDGALYRVGDTLECEPEKLSGAMHCVQDAKKAEAAAEAKVAAEAAEAAAQAAEADATGKESVTEQ